MAPLWIRDFAGAWVFYTVLPGWPRLQPRFERIARFAPWIGLVIGSLQALLWLLLEALGWSPLSLVLAVISFGAWLTGGLHLDGVMDTGDGLAAGRDRCLEAMDDSRVGASGVLALLLVLALLVAALLTLAQHQPSLVPLVLPVVAFWGRCSPLWAMLGFPYLREEGTASFHRTHARSGQELIPAAAVVGLGLVVLLPWPQWRGLLISVPCGLLAAWGVATWLGRRLGGHTGDTYGASVVWTETLTLVLLALLLGG
jgi:adenosylcobinamide-GDP ribazoletransferase